MYAIGDAKYERSSLRAIARMLLMGRRSSGRHGFTGSRRRFFGRERQEDLLEAHAHRPELEKVPPAADDGAGELAADVVPLLAFNLVADDAVAVIGFRDAGDSRDARERSRDVGSVPVDLHV